MGEYVTTRSGDFANQLGPWANLVQAIGLDPRSVWMKLFFVVQGAGTLTVIIQFLLNRPWAQTALLAAMLLGLWYLQRRMPIQRNNHATFHRHSTLCTD